MRRIDDINICKESQALVDVALGNQEILKPPSGGFSLGVCFGPIGDFQISTDLEFFACL